MRRHEPSTHRRHGALRWRLPVVLLASWLAGCAAPLKPADLPVERSLAPANAPLWSALAAQRPGDWFHLLNRGDAALEWRVRAIDSAVEDIALQSFIWKTDPTGSRILDAVLAAADRGVRVRILLDDSFLAGADAIVGAVDRHPNIEYRVYNPLVERRGGMATRELANIAAFRRIDHRMHNKLLVVDGRVAIVGGRNMADEYYGYHPTHNFRDMEVLLGGPFVVTLGGAFDAYWNNHWSIPVARVVDRAARDSDLAALRKSLIETHAALPPRSRVELREAWVEVAADAAGGEARLLIDTPPVARPGESADQEVQLSTQFIGVLATASDEVVLATAYFVPTPELVEALEALVRRGVALRVLTNSLNSNNHVAAHAAYQHHRGEMLRIGSELYEVRADAKDRHRYIQPPVERRLLGLHAKLAVIDRDRVFVGSANLDPRSLRINSEMGLVIASPELNQRLRDQLADDLSGRNAWRVEAAADGTLSWISDDGRSERQPVSSFFLRLENSLFGLLPIEGEM